jgi:hypothetical protein
LDVVENERRFSGELVTLLWFKQELSEQYCIFHGVHWSKVEADAVVYGEIYFKKILFHTSSNLAPRRYANNGGTALPINR